MTVFSSIRFLFATLAVTSGFIVIFTGANNSEKWALDIPVSSFDQQANTLTLTFDVDDSITLANTMASVWDEGCTEVGNQLLVTDGVENLKTAVGIVGEASLSFYLNYPILKQNVNVFTELPAQNAAEMKICARFMLYTDDGFTEVNYLDSIITITFDLNGQATTSTALQKREKGISDNAAETYGADAYLCDPSNPSVELTGITFQQGAMINVCVTPSAEALADDLRLKSIDSFGWSKGNIAAQNAIGSGGAANVLSSLSCAPSSIYCSVTSLLKADFYRTTDAPTSAPTSAPTPTPAPTGGSICEGVSASFETKLDFFDSVLKQNDLQSGGELRFGNIGNISGAPVDLLITSTDYSHKNPNANGKDATENFGEIGVLTQEGDMESGKGTFDFCFVQPDTYTTTMASSFQWSVFDLDNRGGGNPGINEKISITTNQVAGYSLYPNSILTEIDQYCENDNSAPPCDPNVRTVFEGTKVGSGTDNPTDPGALTEEQKKRSVVFTFANTSCWTMEFNSYCTGEPAQSCGWYGGSKLLFSGAAQEIVQQGETDCGGSDRRNLLLHPTVNSNGNNYAEEERDLQEVDIVTGSGTVILMFSTRRRLKMDNGGNRILQADPQSAVELNVNLERADEDYRLSQTAGGLSKQFLFWHLFIFCFNAAILLVWNCN